MKAIFVICGAIISGLLLGASFPNYDASFLAWVGLAPLFLALDRVRPIAGFFLSFIFGVFFYTCVFYWMFDLQKYSVLHHAVLGVYLCPLLGLFGAFFCFSSKKYGLDIALFLAPFVWVSLEYVRSNLFFLSLPWALLAHSQHQYPILIQAANFAGVSGVSFLIVLVNSGVTAFLNSLLIKKKLNHATGDVPTWRRSGAAVIGCAVIAFLGNIFYGYTLMAKPAEGEKINLSVVQGNIEQSKKWDPKYEAYIMQVYTELTQNASQEKPLLVVWPETATPRSITENYGLYRQVKKIAKEAGAPLLLGSSERQKIETKNRSDRKYLNSAFLVRAKPVKEKIQRYDKIRLLPFGEYMPYEETVPWEYLQVPKVSAFVPGDKFTIFKLPSFRFGVTICWENIFPALVRKSVRAGAQFIVNIANEAWFGKSAASYQFLSMSVFRAVENGVFVIRCCNTGISCIIDPYGRIVNRLVDKTGQDLFVRGVLTGSVIPSNSETFYNKFGDMFIYVCLVATAFYAILSMVKFTLFSAKFQINKSCN